MDAGTHIDYPGVVESDRALAGFRFDVVAG